MLLCMRDAGGRANPIAPSAMKLDKPGAEGESLDQGLPSRWQSMITRGSPFRGGDR